MSRARTAIKQESKQQARRSADQTELLLGAEVLLWQQMAIPTGGATSREAAIELFHKGLVDGSGHRKRCHCILMTRNI